MLYEKFDLDTLAQCVDCAQGERDDLDAYICTTYPLPPAVACALTGRILALDFQLQHLQIAISNRNSSF